MDFGERELQNHLIIMYNQEQKSLRDISKELQIPLKTLHKIFEDLGIRTRTHKKAARLWHKKRIKEHGNI